MSRPDDIPQAVWDKANEADTDCQRNSCKERACNGFLCVRALRIGIIAAVAEEREANIAIAKSMLGEGSGIEPESVKWVRAYRNAIRNRSNT